MAEEIWKVIPGFENYKASNFGQIRRIKTETDCTYASLAPKFGVTPEMISKICNRDFRTNI